MFEKTNENNPFNIGKAYMSSILEFSIDELNKFVNEVRILGDPLTCLEHFFCSLIRHLKMYDAVK